jgi:ribose 5-phosphate isomerase B
MKIALGADHAGYYYKKHLIAFIEHNGHETIDFGTDSPESVDYADFAHPVANAVSEGKADFGVLICGSGNGVAITANKHQTIRCALCWTEEIATLAREHNNANIIAIPARFVDEAMAASMVTAFLKTEFMGGRHARRVDKIAC